jgi:NADH:ubiquinone oxidoreductase subunit E
MKERKKFIFVCSGKDCKKNGAGYFSKTIKNAMGEVNFKGKFKLVKSNCMDCCKSGPVAVMGQQLIKKGDVEKLVDILSNEVSNEL